MNYCHVFRWEGWGFMNLRDNQTPTSETQWLGCFQIQRLLHLLVNPFHHGHITRLDHLAWGPIFKFGKIDIINNVHLWSNTQTAVHPRSPRELSHDTLNHIVSRGGQKSKCYRNGLLFTVSQLKVSSTHLSFYLRMYIRYYQIWYKPSYEPIILYMNSYLNVIFAILKDSTMNLDNWIANRIKQYVSTNARNFNIVAQVTDSLRFLYDKDVLLNYCVRYCRCLLS